MGKNKKRNYTTIDDKIEKDLVKEMKNKGFRKANYEDYAGLSDNKIPGYLRQPIYVNDKGAVWGYCSLKAHEGAKGKDKYCLRFKGHMTGDYCPVQIRKWGNK